MTHILINTQTGERTPIRGPYTVNGKPGELPEHIVELRIVQDAFPDVGENQLARPTEVIDMEAGTFTKTWVIESYDPAVPGVISPRQMRRWLDSVGIDDSMIESQLVTKADRIDWEYATEIRRDHPLVARLGAFLNLDEDGIDLAFRAASAL